MKERLPFARDLSLGNFADLQMFSTGTTSLSVLLLFLCQSRSSSLCTVFDSISSYIDDAFSINPSGNVFVYSGGTDGSGELCYNIYMSYDLTEIVNWILDCDSHNLAPSSDTSICSTMVLPPLGNSDHVVVSVSIDFPSNSQRDAPFHRIAYDYSRADWDGLRDHFRDVPWDNIFKLGASASASEFCKWVQVRTDVCIPHCKYQIKPHCSAAIVHSQLSNLHLITK